MGAPEPEAVRATLAALDTRRQKIVSGLVALMMRDADKVQDREWMAEQLTQVTLLAGEFPAEDPQGTVGAVQEFLRANADTVLAAALQLFQRVGLDLAPRAAEGFTFEDAMHVAIGYLPPADAEPAEG